MSFHRFDKPVTIRWERGMQDIGDVERALQVMQGWVRDKGLTPEIAAAYIVCYGAIADPPTSSIEDARKAFVEAARERGKLRGE